MLGPGFEDGSKCQGIGCPVMDTNTHYEATVDKIRLDRHHCWLGRIGVERYWHQFPWVEGRDREKALLELLI